MPLHLSPYACCCSAPPLVQDLPGLYAVAMVAASLLLGGAVRVIPFTLFGTYLSWAYLRFLQSRNGAR
jgi:hypothetical protein